MQPSFMRTLFVVPLGSRNPTSLLTAPGVPLRVVVRNVSVVEPIIISYDVNDLAPTASSEVFNIPVGGEDIFVLAPGQKLYATTTVATAGSVTLACSEAFPVM